MIGSQSIKRKQMLLLMLTSGVALVLACSAFLAYERFSFREGLTHKLDSLAGMVGTAATGALEFRDTKVAQEILATLADEENITAAVIYDRERRPFVQYVRADPTGSPVAFTPPAPLSDGHDFTTTHLSLFRRITSRGERIGIIYLESDLSELSGRLHQYVQIVLGCCWRPGL